MRIQTNEEKEIPDLEEDIKTLRRQTKREEAAAIR